MGDEVVVFDQREGQPFRELPTAEVLAALQDADLTERFLAYRLEWPDGASAWTYTDLTAPSLDRVVLEQFSSDQAYAHVYQLAQRLDAMLLVVDSDLTVFLSQAQQARAAQRWQQTAHVRVVGSPVAFVALVRQALPPYRPRSDWSDEPDVQPPSATPPPQEDATSAPLLAPGVYGLASADLDGRMVMVSAESVRVTPPARPTVTLRVWEPATGETLAEVPTGHTGDVLGLAVGRVDGHLVAVTGGHDHRVEAVDLTQQRSRWWLEHNNPVHDVAVTEPAADAGGAQLALSAGHDEVVGVWALGDGRPWHRLGGRGGQVFRVAAGEVDGRPVAVAGGLDGVVRKWDPVGGRLLRRLVGHAGQVSGLVAGRVGGRPVAVSVATDQVLRVWGLADGRRLGAYGLADEAARLVMAWVGGQPRLAMTVGYRADRVQVWRLGVEGPAGAAVATARPLRVLRFGLPVTALAAVGDGLLAVGTSQGVRIVPL